MLPILGEKAPKGFFVADLFSRGFAWLQFISVSRGFFIVALPFIWLPC
jgi:hypothetical protein